MANHPARPAHPFIDPREMRDELTDLDALTRDIFGADVPLRDRVALLADDWADTTVLCEPSDADEPWGVTVVTVNRARVRMYARRGLT